MALQVFLSQNIQKKSLPVGGFLFVFAFFLIRRNASQSGEGKKECEEKRFDTHAYFFAHWVSSL
ncbi:hypothetical protein BS639_07015 [Rouxiella silvae]|uniref:Uncharacterized protein n=1 Tax=Rouxiella silvae TaxID=1646373 RepID=A0ABX3U3G6_9GAMM|nr:hypothetical protein ASE93_06405 [Serratia sp. Leaf50]ORJ22038.1 hypothetical protein BS639_07015 [Rouxiella silvae]